MDIELWFVFVVLETALCLTPGPAVLYVFSVAARYGAPASMSANAGVVTGNTVYFILTALGLGAIILASHNLFSALKWIGALYLIWLGLNMVIGQRSAPETKAGPVPSMKLFRGGAALQLANPKSLIFFGAILPQFVDPHGVIWLQFLILGVTSQVIEALVLGAYGLMADRSAQLIRMPNFAASIDRVSGGLLMIFGVGLALWNRPSD